MLASIVKIIGLFPVMLLAVALLLILVLVLYKKRTGNKKVLLTKEFKEVVKGIDLNLSEETSAKSILTDKEEILLALKELYEHDFISNDEYQMRAEKILNEVKNLSL